MNHNGLWSVKRLNTVTPITVRNIHLSGGWFLLQSATISMKLNMLLTGISSHRPRFSDSTRNYERIPRTKLLRHQALHPIERQVTLLAVFHAKWPRLFDMHMFLRFTKCSKRFRLFQSSFSWSKSAFLLPHEVEFGAIPEKREGT